MLPLNAIEKAESSGHLDLITGASHLHRYPYPNAQAKLSEYLELIQKIKTKKNFRIFTNNVTAFPHSLIPNLYFTNLGAIVFRIIFDNMTNPYLTQIFQDTILHPEIHLFSQLVNKHKLSFIPITAYQQIEHACETCFADFKVHIQTRNFIAQHRSWNTQYRFCSNSYDKFMDFIYRTTNKFEVHSLLVQRKRPNGSDPSFGTPDFQTLSSYEIVREKSNEIIKDIWRKRQQHNVIGILSREEVNIEQTYSIRLIFFVQKSFSDHILFDETSLYKAISPHLIDHNLDRIALGTIHTMNSNVAPLFQGQEQNYYDLNQVNIGNRLKVLKAHLIIPSYWFRLRYDSCVPNIERGQMHYER